VCLICREELAVMKDDLRHFSEVCHNGIFSKNEKIPIYMSSEKQTLPPNKTRLTKRVYYS